MPVRYLLPWLLSAIPVVAVIWGLLYGEQNYHIAEVILSFLILAGVYPGKQR